MRRILRLLRTQTKSAFYNIGRNLSMSFFAIVSISITLVLMSIFSMITLNIDYIAQKVQSNVMLRVSIDNRARASEKLALLEKVEKTTGVKSVHYNSKDRELLLYTSKINEDGKKILKNYQGSKNPLRDVIVVSLEGDKTQDPLGRLKELAQVIKQYPHVEEVDYGGAGVESLIKIVSLLRIGGFVMTVLLSFLSISLIANTIKTNIYSRKSEIVIMKNVGASNAFIAFPFVIEGFILGCLGSLFPIALTVFGYSMGQEYFHQLVNSSFFFLETSPFVEYLSVYLLVVAITVGVMGSHLAVTKHMDLKR